MKTQVIMHRRFLNGDIRQKSKTGYLSATDLIQEGNNWRVLNRLPLFNFDSWKSTKSTKEFVSELEKQFGKVTEATRGKNGGTWMHPYLFIDLALAISPKLKIEVYKWLYDQLLEYRNDSGNSYKKMAGALYDNSSNKSDFHRGMTSTANMIKRACKVKDWQTASETQLQLRNKIHDNITLLCDVLRDNNQAIKIGINKALK